MVSGTAAKFEMPGSGATRSPLSQDRRQAGSFFNYSIAPLGTDVES